jgi:hypothetical protein
MPHLVRLYVHSVALGFILAAVFVLLLLWLDVAGLRGLVLGTREGWIGGVMLIVFNGIVFSGAQFGIAVMRAAEPPRDGGGPHGGLPVPAVALAGRRARSGRGRRSVPESQRSQVGTR